MKLNKIISGGQTGVDQAALQAAIDAGLDHGGWCPPGRVCESGFIPPHFNLMETPRECDPSAPDVPRSQRTIWNVRDADGVLIFMVNSSDPGTELATESAKKFKKPAILVQVFHEIDPTEFEQWLVTNAIQTLSVGGPSEQTCPGVYDFTYALLSRLLSPV